MNYLLKDAPGADVAPNFVDKDKVHHWQTRLPGLPWLICRYDLRPRRGTGRNTANIQGIPPLH
jgi:hypothetical protein